MNRQWLSEERKKEREREIDRYIERKEGVTCRSNNLNQSFPS